MIVLPQDVFRPFPTWPITPTPPGGGKMNLLLYSVFLISCVQDRDLSGIYEVQGVQIVEGKRITYAALAFVKHVPDTDKYIIQWTSGIGNNITGVGFLSKDKLVFTWRSGETSGYTEYKIGPKGVHKGQWFVTKGIDLWHIETLTYRMPWTVPNVEDSDEQLHKEKGKTGKD